MSVALLQNNIIQKYVRGYLSRKYIHNKIINNLFKDVDWIQFTKMLHDTYHMPDDNMFRFIKSEMRERVLCSLLPNCKYVGNDKYFETDIIFPNITEKHIKLEVKCVKGLFRNKKGDSSGIILKNGRGKGQTIHSLLHSTKKNVFILIDTKPPFSICYCFPNQLMFYIDKKSNAVDYKTILNSNELLNKRTAELYGYINKKNVYFIKDMLIDNNYIYDDYNPVNELMSLFIERYNDP